MGGTPVKNYSTRNGQTLEVGGQALASARLETSEYTAQFGGARAVHLVCCILSSGGEPCPSVIQYTFPWFVRCVSGFSTFHNVNDKNKCTLLRIFFVPQIY